MAGASLSISILRDLWTALGGKSEFLSNLDTTGSGDLPSVFPVSDLAAAAIGAAGLAMAEHIAAISGASSSTTSFGLGRSSWEFCF
jgi:hypothetical protein